MSVKQYSPRHAGQAASESYGYYYLPRHGADQLASLSTLCQRVEALCELAELAA